MRPECIQLRQLLCFEAGQRHPIPAFKAAQFALARGEFGLQLADARLRGFVDTGP